MMADDHQLVLDSISRSLPQEFELIGTATNGEELIKMLRSGTVPDVLLLDLRMPGLSGFSLLPIIRTEFPKVKTIVVSMYWEPDVIKTVFQSGACGYLSKNMAYEELLDAIRTVHKNGRYISKSSPMPAPDQTSPPNEELPLSVREKSILRLYCEGMAPKLIAEHLQISINTVRFHIKNIHSKTGRSSLADLTKYAVLKGLTDLGSNR